METSELEELLAGWQGMELPVERQEYLLRPVNKLPSGSSTPGVLVNSNSFSAPSTAASSPATRSALILFFL